MDDSQWHILRVVSGTEAQVASECGYPAYVPRQRKQRFNRRLRKNVVYYTPLLTGFVFINIAEPADFKAVPNKNRIGFLRNGDRSPARLSAQAFNQLRETEKQFCSEIVDARPPFDALDTTKLEIMDMVVIMLQENPVIARIKKFMGDKLLTETVDSKLRLVVDRSSVVAA